MTARIIGAPPEQKRSGAVFGDVPDRSFFSMKDPRCDGRVTCQEWNGEAHAVAPGDDAAFFPDHDEPVILLTLTPAEPPDEDPAVTTYGELEPGSAGSPWEFFEFVSAPNMGPQLRIEDGHIRQDSISDTHDEDEPVRRVHPIEAAAHIAGAGASVVVHEEPGTAVGELIAGFIHIDSPVTKEGLEALVRQGVARLALISAPEPTTAGPEPCSVPLDRDGLEDALGEPRTPVTLADVNEGAEQASERVDSLPRWQRELTPGSLPEDRSKPAPDWTVGRGGCSNTSDLFVELTNVIREGIVESARELLSGRQERVARRILAGLAHKHGLAPHNAEQARKAAES